MKCYHAETDGWDSTTFHSKCDGKGPIVSIIQVTTHLVDTPTCPGKVCIPCQLLIIHRGGGG